MNLNPEKTAVIVVDMQNCFAHEDGSLYSPASETIIEDIEQFLESNPDEILTVYTRDTHTKQQFDEMTNYDEFDRGGEHAIDGSWGHKIVNGISTMQSDFILDKSTYDAFYNTNLDCMLQERDIDSVIICGTLANVCVMHTASSAALNDYQTIVLEDLVGYIEETDKDYALDHIDWLFGSVKNTTEISF